MTESKSSVGLNEVVTDEIKISLPESITTLPTEAPLYTSNFEGMFKGIKVEGELGISTWEVSHITNMSHTFEDSSIPDDLSEWSVSNVTDFTYMFSGAINFNQDLSGWDVRRHPVEPEGFSYNTPKWELPKPRWGIPIEEDERNLVAVVTKNTIKPKEFKKVYTCSTFRINSIVDISIFSDIEDKKRFDNKVNVYLSENRGLTKADNRYLIMKDVPISNFEISKIVVGSGQSLYVESACTADINVRVNGLEENSDMIPASGLISTITINSVGINEVYRLDYPLAAYASLNINVVNNTNTDDEVTLWITDNQDIETVNVEHRLVDKIDRRVVKKKTTYTLMDITLGPNERIYIDSKVLGLVVNVTGMVINANF